MTDWTFQGNIVEQIDPMYVGFVYCITRLSDGKMYYGKKKCFFSKTSLKTVTLKSGEKKKKKIRTVVDSDWKDYYGSSDLLKADIEINGKDAYSREILRFCTTLSEASYYEAKVQLETDCLLYPDKYFNSWISFRVRRSNLVKS